jgi:hypothetical protein
LKREGNLKPTLPNNVQTTLFREGEGRSPSFKEEERIANLEYI